MFVNVVAVLEVAVSVMKVVDVITVLHRLVAIPLEVSPVVIGVNHLFGVGHPVVQMVDVPIVLNGLMAVTGKMLVIGSGMGCS